MGWDLDEAIAAWDNSGRPEYDDEERMLTVPELFDMNEEKDLSEAGYGPVVTAGFESECAGTWDECDGTIYEGDRIRGKNGEWFHVGCEV